MQAMSETPGANGRDDHQASHERSHGRSEWFPDRELFLRGGGLKYFRLTRRRQLGLLAVGVAAGLWIAGATATTVYLGFSQASAQRELEDRKLAYLALLSDIGEYQAEFARIIGNLEGNQSLLLSRLESADDDTDGVAVAEIEGQLSDTETDKARMLVIRETLRDRLAAFEDDLRQLAERESDQSARLEATLATLEEARAEGAELAAARQLLDRELRRSENDVRELASERGQLELALSATRDELSLARRETESLKRRTRALRAEVDSLYTAMGDAPRREAEFGDEIAGLERDLEDAEARADALRAERDFQQDRAEQMEARLDEVGDIQSAVIARLAHRTMAGIDMIERVVAMTGLDVNELIGASETASLGLAQGGPYFHAAGEALAGDDPNLEFESSVVVLNQQMDRWEALQEVIRTIPLASPLDHYRVASGYGERVDPVNGRKAMHYGVDLKAPMRTPVMATAPGTVVYAGWRGQYGRFVEIDHGNGIRTRYAHMRKLLVQKGQEVAHRQEIGLLGNSGRSTGAHVHYEILVHGKPKDPARFVMAGRNAFKE